MNVHLLHTEYQRFLEERFSAVPLMVLPGTQQDQTMGNLGSLYIPPGFRPARFHKGEETPIDRTRMHYSDYGTRMFRMLDNSFWVPYRDLIVSPDRLLKDYQRIAVLGNVGSGKSALLAFLALKAWKRPALQWPIYYQLRDCQPQRDSHSLCALTPPTWKKETASLFIDHLLQNESCLVLFDGLDEVISEARSQVIDEINGIVSAYPHHHYVLTSRPDCFSAEDFGDAFDVFFIEPFNGPQTERWIRRLYRSIGHLGEAHYLINLLRQRELLFAHIPSPLLLKAVINLHLQGKKDLRQFIDELCHQCLELLLEGWDRIKGISNMFVVDFKLEILQPLALYLLEQYPEPVYWEKAIKVASHKAQRLLKEEYIEHVLLETAYRNGLLLIQPDKQVRFSTSWLQAYLAARELSTQPDAPERLLKNIGKPLWEQTCVCYASLHDATYLIGLLLGSDDPFYDHLLLAGQCAIVAKNLDEGMRDQLVMSLFSLHQHMPFETVATRALRILVSLNTQDARIYVLSLLESMHSDRCTQALTALSQEPSPQFFEFVVKCFEENRQHLVEKSRLGSPHIRNLVIDVLGRMPTEDATTYLANLHPEPAWKVHVVEALGWHGRSEHMPFFERALEEGIWSARQRQGAELFNAVFGADAACSCEQNAGDIEDALRKAAARGLALLEDDQGIGILYEKLQHDNWLVRLESAHALMYAWQLEGVVPVMQQAIRHWDASVRYVASGLFDETGAQVIPFEQYMEMASIMLDDPIWRVPGGLLANWSIDSDLLLDRIIALCEHPIPYVHARAVRALGAIHTERARTTLFDYLNSPHATDGQRLSACEGLRGQRIAEAEGPVLGFLNKGVNEVFAERMLFYLLSAGSTEALPTLQRYLVHPAPELRRAAFEATRAITRRSGVSLTPEFRLLLKWPHRYEGMYYQRFATGRV